MRIHPCLQCVFTPVYSAYSSLFAVRIHPCLQCVFTPVFSEYSPPVFSEYSPPVYSEYSPLFTVRIHPCLQCLFAPVCSAYSPLLTVRILPCLQCLFIPVCSAYSPLMTVYTGPWFPQYGEGDCLSPVESTACSLHTVISLLFSKIPAQCTHSQTNEMDLYIIFFNVDGFITESFK